MLYETAWGFVQISPTFSEGEGEMWQLLMHMKYTHTVGNLIVIG